MPTAATLHRLRDRIRRLEQGCPAPIASGGDAAGILPATRPAGVRPESVPLGLPAIDRGAALGRAAARRGARDPVRRPGGRRADGLPAGADRAAEGRRPCRARSCGSAAGATCLPQPCRSMAAIRRISCSCAVPQRGRGAVGDGGRIALPGARRRRRRCRHAGLFAATRRLQLAAEPGRRAPVPAPAAASATESGGKGNRTQDRQRQHSGALGRRYPLGRGRPAARSGRFLDRFRNADRRPGLDGASAPLPGRPARPLAGCLEPAATGVRAGGSARRRERGKRNAGRRARLTRRETRRGTRGGTGCGQEYEIRTPAGRSGYRRAWPAGWPTTIRSSIPDHCTMK